MKSVSFALASLAAMAAAGSNYEIQSRPFRLLIHSGNYTTDSTVFAALHAGAAIEVLAITHETLDDPADSASIFTHSVSTTPDAIDTDGNLHYVLQASKPIPSVMSIYQMPSSNIAIPYFSPGEDDTALVAFDQDGAMYISMKMDDTVSPPEQLETAAKVENWHTCLNSYGSYTYVSLSWKIGLTGEPQNPSCEKVEVQRVFVGEEAQAIAKMKAKKAQQEQQH